MAKYKSPKLPFDVVTLETFSNTKTPEYVRFPKWIDLSDPMHLRHKILNLTF